MVAQLERQRFRELEVTDQFFDSLRADYAEFPAWFAGKADEEAYVLRDGAALVGFMYVKQETGPVSDVLPEMEASRRLKIGTLKVDAHGTRLSQRFIKKALDHAIHGGATELYVTVFPKHAVLIGLLEEFGFRQTGTKTTANGTELVLSKSLTRVTGNLRIDYPRFRVVGNRAFLLPIQPQWHTQLFPDSILTSESYDVVHDVSHTNSIEKVYICFMEAAAVRRGDLLVIYRTSDGKGPAEYRSVVTSICTAEEIRPRHSFGGQDDYLAYCEKGSVFSSSELRKLWQTRRQREMVVIKMLYNAALTRRLTRKALIEEVGVDRRAYPGFLELTAEQLRVILRLGGVDESLAIDQA